MGLCELPACGTHWETNLPTPLITSLFKPYLQLWSPEEHGLTQWQGKAPRVALTLLIQISPGIWLELICISSQGLMRIRVMGMLPLQQEPSAVRTLGA